LLTRLKPRAHKCRARGFFNAKIDLQISLQKQNNTEKIHKRHGQLILRKISKIDGATRYQILRPKYAKFDYRWCRAPDAAGKLSALPRPPS